MDMFRCQMSVQLGERLILLFVKRWYKKCENNVFKNFQRILPRSIQHEKFPEATWPRGKLIQTPNPAAPT